MALNYVSTGAWGSGLARPLTIAEADGNIYQLVQDIAAAAAAAGDPVGIAAIVADGNQITVTLTDTTTQGPFTLPKARFNYRGNWLPATSYGLYDVVKVTNQGVYMVEVLHTSAATFDSARQISGQDVYANIMPAAEQARQVTTNVTGTTYTPVASDVNKLLRCTNAGGCTVTLPSGIFSVDDELYFLQAGDAAITFDVETDGAFEPSDLFEYTTIGRGSLVMMKMVSTDVWLRSGNLTEAVTA